MNFEKHSPNDSDVIVKVMSSSCVLEVIVVRNTYEKVKLGGKDYFRYQIVKPEGYEREEIIHRIGQSYEGLVCSVFMTLAEARSSQQDKTSGIILPNRRCPASGENPDRSHSCFEDS